MGKERRLGSILISILSIASAVNAAEQMGVRQEVSRETLARKTMSLLAAENFDALAELHHFPSSYSPAETTEDKAAVARSLAFVFTRAGKMSDMQPLAESDEFYFIAMGGGDVSYWQTIPASARREYPYSATFSNIGLAMVKVIVLAAGPRPGQQLVGIQLGLSTKRAGGKEALVRLSLDLLKEMKIQTPPNIEDAVRQSMERAVVGPARFPQ